MRLIDADKLVEICRKGWKLFGRENEKLKHWVDEYDIRSQPTVNAIPIEWIKKWVEKTFDVESQYEVYPLIELMLLHWEKENE